MRCGLVASWSWLGGAEQPVLVPVLRGLLLHCLRCSGRRGDSCPGGAPRARNGPDPPAGRWLWPPPRWYSNSPAGRCPRWPLAPGTRVAGMPACMAGPLAGGRPAEGYGLAARVNSVW